MRFGSVRLGVHVDFSTKRRPFVIVTKDEGIPPPNLDICPSTSQKHTPRSDILCLPPRVIDFIGDRDDYVKSYVLCYKKFQVVTVDVYMWRFLNNLEPPYLKQLEECLEAAKRCRHG